MIYMREGKAICFKVGSFIENSCLAGEISCLCVWMQNNVLKSLEILHIKDNYTNFASEICYSIQFKQSCQFALSKLTLN